MGSCCLTARSEIPSLHDISSVILSGLFFKSAACGESDLQHVLREKKSIHPTSHGKCPELRDDRFCDQDVVCELVDADEVSDAVFAGD